MNKHQVSKITELELVNNVKIFNKKVDYLISSIDEMIEDNYLQQDLNDSNDEIILSLMNMMP